MRLPDRPFPLGHVDRGDAKDRRREPEADNGGDLLAEQDNTQKHPDTGPKDPALRKARVCYNHLAGELGVRLLDSLSTRGLVIEDGDILDLTGSGEAFVTGFGIDMDGLKTSRRPLCKSCLDWSARRSHLAGSLGTAFLQRFYEQGWAKREDGTRVVRFTKRGEAEFLEHFPA
ncbi:MAG: hypothetical protein ACR2PM_00975 [Hyphomicrobiales bacterium]